MACLLSVTLCASGLASAAAAVLDLPIRVFNGYSTVDFGIGTPEKTYRLLFDTGSSSSWAVNDECAKNTCSNVSGYDRVGYNFYQSSTGNYTGGYARIPYLGGDVAGPAVSEVWTVGDFEWRQDFIAVAESNWAALAADGFMGLGFSSIIDGGANTVVETLMAAGKLDKAQFGIYYGTEFDDTNGPGEGVLTLGGSREKEYVAGSSVVMPVIRNGGTYDVWRSHLYGVSGKRTTSDGKVVESTTDFNIGNVVFDTGASSISFPDEENIKVYESIGWNYTAILHGQHIPLCSEFNSSWSVSFNVGDPSKPSVVTLTGDQLKSPGFANRDDACWPPFEGGNAEGFTLIGKRLLRNFYTVWDFGVPGNETNIDKFEPTLSFSPLK